ncbi:MAG: YwbE family protein [Candidatus Thorarchaeota archaeon]|nr:MAG: YwbE family protein [Candidatus Thorarchaeota archaeon]
MNTETDNAGTHRENIHPGLVVDVILKKDQATGKLTRGVVKDILTNSSVHPRGIKVRLKDGQVGRVWAIVRQSSGKPGT